MGAVVPAGRLRWARSAMRTEVLGVLLLGLVSGCGGPGAEGGRGAASSGGAGGGRSRRGSVRWGRGGAGVGYGDGSGGGPPTECPGRLAPLPAFGVDAVVGDGSVGTCTLEALHAAVSLIDGSEGGGTLRFDCGEAHTFALDRTLFFERPALVG